MKRQVGDRGDKIEDEGDGKETRTDMKRQVGDRGDKIEDEGDGKETRTGRERRRGRKVIGGRKEAKRSVETG